MKGDNIAAVLLIILPLSFISGYALSNSDHAGKDAVMEQFQSWSLQEQQDFIMGATNNKPSLTTDVAIAIFLKLPRDDKRDTLLYLNTNNEIPNEASKAIAEDWCAINKQTQRGCWNAKMNHPIRGVK